MERSTVTDLGVLPAEPHAQMPSSGPATPPAVDPPRPRRRRGVRLLLWLLTVVVAVLVAVALTQATRIVDVLDAATQRASGGGTPTALPGAAATDPDAVGGAGERVLSASLDGREELGFDLVTGSTSVSVRSADLGGNLYRVATPTGGNALPKIVDQSTRVMLQLVPTGRTGPSAVEIQLSSKVRWNLRLTGGATEHLIDMGNGQLAGFEILGGATRLELSIPKPKGTVPIQINSGLGQLVLKTPKGTASRLRIGNGSESVTLDGNARGRVSPGTVFTPNGWDRTTNRYEVNAAAGVGSLTLQRF